MQQGAAVNESASNEICVAVAGNPNCGKTTLFNALTGLHYKVANYPGVTVEHKDGKLALDGLGAVKLVDLPGMYSLSGNALDERIATQAVLGLIPSISVPSLIISVVDATNLERNLYLTSQLIDLGLPVVLVLNMIDLANRQGIDIKAELLSRMLDIPVVKVCAQKQQGLEDLRAEVTRMLRNPRPSAKRGAWLADAAQYRSAAEELGALHARDLGIDADRASLLLGCNLLSDSFAPLSSSVSSKLEESRALLRKAEVESISFEATGRYRWINELIRSSVVQRGNGNRFSDKVDWFMTHRIWGTLTFLLIMLTIFQSIFMWATLPMDAIDSAVASFGGFVGKMLPAGELRSLVVDGIVAGVGSVLVFIPQIAVLFFFLGLLEDSGYLARAAFLMDKIMRKFGLQGRSFIPLLSSFACAIPGIMSTRSIPSFADRMLTILVAPFMSCSARLPVYALLIAAFIPADIYLLGIFSLQGLTLFFMYFLGITAALGFSWLFRIALFRGEPALFVMELPQFRLPVLRTVLREVWDRVYLFIKSAGTVILACSIVLWFLATYPRGEVRDSFAGRLGRVIEPVIEPLGYDWKIGVSLIASFAAREVFVSSLSTVYNIEESGDSSESLISLLREKREVGSFTTATAVSLMVFYVFACQCMSTLAVCRRETGSWRWPVFMFVYMSALAYVAAFIAYQLLS